MTIELRLVLKPVMLYPCKPGTPLLALYVDEPRRFAGAVGAAVARQLPRVA